MYAGLDETQQSGNRVKHLHRPTRKPPSSVAVPLYLTALLAELSTFVVVSAVLELPTNGHIFNILAFLEEKQNLSGYILEQSFFFCWN